MSLARLGVTLKAAALTGTKVSVQARATKSAVKLRFSVLKAKTAKQALAKGRKTLAVKKAKRFKAITVALDKAPAGTKLFLAVDASSGKRKGRGVLALKVVSTKPGPAAPDPDPTPVRAGPDRPRPRSGQAPRAAAWPTPTPTVTAFPTAPRSPASTTGRSRPRRPAARRRCLVPNVVHVSSDPNKANTDDDAVTVDGTTYALTDGQEWADFLNGGLSNPTVADSDGDGLGDVEEVMRWGTNPSTVDSDSRLRHERQQRPAQPGALRPARGRGTRRMRGPRPPRCRATPTATAPATWRRSSPATAAPRWPTSRRSRPCRTRATP